MKDENTQVPDTFDEQEELRSPKKRAPAIFFKMGNISLPYRNFPLLQKAFALNFFIIAGIFFQKYNFQKTAMQVFFAIGGFVIFGIAAAFFLLNEKYRLCSAVGSRP